MLTTRILLFYLLCTLTHACPLPSDIRQMISFQTVIQQQPFDGLFTGMTVNNGISYQTNGICNHTGLHCNATLPCAHNQDCRPLTKQLIFNVYNNDSNVSALNITNAVRNAKKIVFTGDNKLPPYIPGVLCSNRRLIGVISLYLFTYTLW